ncbi:MAG: ankyrin repeat domain-containing protein [Vicinamibacterales bacterium]
MRQLWMVGALALVLLSATGAAADDTRVANAARAGDLGTVRQLIADRADVNAPEPDGTTALHWAARGGDLAMADALLQAGAQVAATNRYGVSPLSLAAENGDASMLDRLLVAGADARTTLADGQTVLMTAARTGRVEALRRLVAGGADVNAADAWMGETPLMWAAAANNAAAVRTLVELGADLQARSKAIAYPEQKPAEPSNYVSSFAPKGEWTALMYAARENAADAALALLDAGADINAQDPEGVTPVMEAILNLHYDLALTLVTRGADPRLADMAGMTPLFAVVEMRTPSWERSRPRLEEKGEVDAVRLMTALLDHGADPDAALTRRQLVRYHAAGSAAFAEGTTPLMQAVRFKHLDLARLLVARGADVTRAQPDGTNALMIAAGVKYAITQEGDPDNMGSPQDTFEIVKLLVEQGADVNAANARGETALYGAAFLGNELAIRHLVEKGARLDARTRTGRTILDGVLNTGIPDEGTGARPGGKPGPATVALVRTLMVEAGIEPTSGAAAAREARDMPVRAIGQNPTDATPAAVPPTGAAAAPASEPPVPSADGGPSRAPAPR